MLKKNAKSAKSVIINVSMKECYAVLGAGINSLLQNSYLNPLPHSVIWLQRLSRGHTLEHFLRQCSHLVPGYDSKLGSSVNTPIFQVPTWEFGFGNGARAQSTRPCTRAVNWAQGFCVNTFCVGSLNALPTISQCSRFTECEDIFRLGTVCLNTSPFCAGARALVPGHQVWTLHDVRGWLLVYLCPLRIEVRLKNVPSNYGSVLVQGIFGFTELHCLRNNYRRKLWQNVDALWSDHSLKSTSNPLLRRGYTWTSFFRRLTWVL